MIEPPIPAIKRQLAEAIVEVANQTNFFVAATCLGIGNARLSDLRRGRVDRFTIDWLIKILAKVDRRVDVSITVVGYPEVRWFAGSFRPVQRLAVEYRGTARDCLSDSCPLPNLASNSWADLPSLTRCQIWQRWCVRGCGCVILERK